MKKSLLIIAVSALLTLTGTASAATVTLDPGSSGGGTGGGTLGGGLDMEFALTVIKNERPEAAGKVEGAEGTTIAFVRLTSSPIGTYGRLDFGGDGTFDYILNNESPEVQALGINDAVQDTFSFQIVDTDGVKSNGVLIVTVLGNPSLAADNTEIEFNNRSTQATPLNSGQYIRGQLTSSSDKDWYVINSLGNEVIHFELCPNGSQCSDEKAWVLYVFDADLVAEQGIDDAGVTLTLTRDDNLQVIDFFVSGHMYLLHNFGVFDNSLIGIIDPCFGDTNTLDIGVGPGPRNYLIAISTPLLRDGGQGCSSGNVVLTEAGPTFEEPDPANPGKTREVKTTREFIVAFPYNDDLYTIKATRTGVNPLLVQNQESPVFDAVGKSLTIPRVRIDNQYYTADLALSGSSDNSLSFDLLSIQPYEGTTAVSSGTPVYNPATKTLMMPQVVDAGSGISYSAELTYKADKNALEVQRVSEVNE
ncbi:MAG: VCBS domain-containing protein [Gammaproteobacteria bacterium]